MQPLQASFVAYACGLAGLNLSVAMLAPMTIDLIDGNPDWQAFLVSMLALGFVSLMMVLTTMGRRPPFSRRMGFLLVNALWLFVSIGATLPFMLSELNLSLTNALFESVSGLTTTGATILTGLDNMPRGILLWRSLLHWIGGIGIIAMSLMIMPFLRVGGMQVFKMESSAQEDRPEARFSQFVIDILLVYIVLTLACTLAYHLAGMTKFDALNHAMSTLATGGFSTHDTSMINYGTPVHLVAIVFMLAGAMPFFAILRAMAARDIKLAYDPQIPVLMSFVAVFSLLAFIEGRDTAHLSSYFKVLVESIFSVVSIITTTGFASVDYLTWGPFAAGLFYAISFFGGCTGSTAGGAKAFRIIIMAKGLHQSLKELVFPRAVTTLKYMGKQVPDSVVRSVGLFLAVYLSAIVLGTAALSATELDMGTAASAVVSALANVGPGTTELIGPSGNYQSLPDTAKWILTFLMLLGRLDIMTLLVLTTPTFWRG